MISYWPRSVKSDASDRYLFESTQCIDGSLSDDLTGCLKERVGEARTGRIFGYLQ